MNINTYFAFCQLTKAVEANADVQKQNNLVGAKHSYRVLYLDKVKIKDLTSHCVRNPLRWPDTVLSQGTKTKPLIQRLNFIAIDCTSG